MAQLPEIKLRNTILCEHVVDGGNNKHTLINVYSGDIVIETLPAPIMLGIYLEIDGSFQGNLIHLEMLFDDEIRATIDAKMVFKTEDRTGVAVLSVPTMQAGIDKDLIFSVRLTAEGYADTIAIKKRIFRGDISTSAFPNALPPPSEQSPPAAPAS